MQYLFISVHRLLAAAVSDSCLAVPSPPRTTGERRWHLGQDGQEQRSVVMMIPMKLSSVEPNVLTAVAVAVVVVVATIVVSIVPCGVLCFLPS